MAVRVHRTSSREVGGEIVEADEWQELLRKRYQVVDRPPARMVIVGVISTGE
mgnify:CR=1 FL=1